MNGDPALHRASAKHLPWLSGLIAAPLLFGSVTVEGQVVVGCLLAASWWLLARDLNAPDPRARALARWLPWCLAVVWILPLVPLPVGLVKMLSPERVRLDQAFPIGDSPASFLTLGLSSAGTVQRLWELALAFSVFCLARHGARDPAFAPRFVWVIGAALVLLVAADVWFRLDAEERILSLWPNTAGHAHGSFANRNHYANWLLVGAIFVAGSPLALRARRGSRNRTAAWVWLAIIGTAVVTALATGSRGASVAAFVGFGALLAVVTRAPASARPARWIFAAGTAIFIAVVGLGALDFLVGRLGQVRTDGAFKFKLWEGAWSLLAKYPLTGVGWGNFGVAFNYHKDFYGEHTFLHAENDYLQLLAEGGAVGALAIGAALCGLLGRRPWFSWIDRAAHPALVRSALAALVAFGAHALVEFVWEIPATAFLASALLGFVIGSRDAVHAPIIPAGVSRAGRVANWAWGTGLLGLTAAQALAWGQWRAALSASEVFDRARYIETSLQCWPWDSNRQVALVRARAREFNTGAVTRPDTAAQRAEEFRAEFPEMLRRDPYQWNLRLEQAWFDLAFATNRARAVARTWQVVRLNPLQPQIPLQFAKYFADRDPPLALDFLRAVPVTNPDILRQALALGWAIKRDSAFLWELTPGTTAGLMALGDFAVTQQLYPLAVQAYDQVSARTEPLAMAARFSRAQKPERAIALLASGPFTGGARLALARAHAQAGNYLEAIQWAESIWMNSPFRDNILSAAPSPASESTNSKSSPATLPAGAGPKSRLELQSLWRRFTEERHAGRIEAASQIALHLAESVMAEVR